MVHVKERGNQWRHYRAISRWDYPRENSIQWYWLIHQNCHQLTPTWQRCEHQPTSSLGWLHSYLPLTPHERLLHRDVGGGRDECDQQGRAIESQICELLAAEDADWTALAARVESWRDDSDERVGSIGQPEQTKLRSAQERQHSLRRPNHGATRPRSWLQYEQKCNWTSPSMAGAVKGIICQQNIVGWVREGSSGRKETPCQYCESEQRSEGWEIRESAQLTLGQTSRNQHWLRKRWWWWYVASKRNKRKSVQKR